MKLISKKPTIKDGVEYPYLAVSLSMSPLWKPNLGASVAIRFTPFRELEDGTYEYWDGIFMIETHTWCSKLNNRGDFPSFSLINHKFDKSLSRELLLKGQAQYG